MATFLALYQGRTVGQAQMIAICTDAELVSLVAARLLENNKKEKEVEDDPVTGALNNGRRQALQIIQGRQISIMRRKAVTLSPAPTSLSFQQAVDRFQQATAVLQQIAARVDAADETQIKTQGEFQAADIADGTTQIKPLTVGAVGV